MKLIRTGIAHVFCNDLEKAELVFKKGMNQPALASHRMMQGDHDLRGSFALQWALVAVIRGISSLANDQLDECLTRLWRADELTTESDDWVGKSVVRGICNLAGGIIQLMQFSFAKGVWNVLNSWRWIRDLKPQ